MKDPRYTRGTQEEMMKDPKWNGVPPMGDRPIGNKNRFLSLILLVFLVKILIWGAYRYITGNVEPFTDPVVNYSMGTFMKPLLQLGPLVILWWYVFKEKGSPFRFTKKNLASSIFFGLVMAFVFFFVATFVYIVHNLIMGYGTDFHFVAGWDEVGWILVIATMLSYMIGTGPAEELFSRGFLQDQAARVIPFWQAMVFSAVLFAAGHLPISILMHKMPFEEIMWYMAVLVVMGLFFSIIYQWSRNIVFPILIHGLWDWYLTLFAIKGEFTYDFAQNSGAFFGMVDFINTIITLIILLPIFYLIYRKFWRRNLISTGSPIDTPKYRFAPVRWLREKDLGEDFRRPVVVTVAVTTMFCLLMLPFAAVIGVDDPELQKDRTAPGGGETIIVLEQKRVLFGSELEQGQNAVYTLEVVNQTITWVNLSLTWEDEPDAGIRYSNQPDGFRVSILDENGEELEFKGGTTGDISLIWVLPEGQEPAGEISIMVELTATGDQEPLVNFLGLREIADDSNTYGLDVKYEFFYSVKEETGDLNVRW